MSKVNEKMPNCVDISTSSCSDDFCLSACVSESNFVIAKFDNRRRLLPFGDSKLVMCRCFVPRKFFGKPIKIFRDMSLAICRYNINLKLTDALA